MNKTKIGVLALQGDFELHLKTLAKLDCESFEVRTPEHLAGADGLVIPGGESTTVGKLLVTSGLAEEIPRRYAAGTLAIFGTCMGAIIIAKRIENKGQFTLGLLDATVRRNSYGRQVDSFETDIPVEGIGANGNSVHAVFIRAPQILSTGPDVKTLAVFAGLPVLVRQDRILACCFHPEVTGETRVHEYFIGMSARKE
jgi:pyridoxal 5'-phosphate synthase pdxT subunit